MASELSLYIIDTVDPRFIRVVDTSVYDPTITVSCERLMVMAPGAPTPAFIPTTKNFSESLSSITLKRTREDVGILVDGIYNFHYSINPNEQVFVEYNHLRTTNILARYMKVLCSLQVDCNLDKDKREKLSRLREVSSLIEAAKAYVEYCNAPDRGMKLFEYASAELAKLEEKNQHCYGKLS